MSDESPETTPPKRQRFRRALTVASIASFIVSIAVFVLVSYAFQTNLGVVIATVAGGLTGATAWWLMSSGESRDRLQKVLVNLPAIGRIPTHRGVAAPTLEMNDAAAAYRAAAAALESQTTGSILLFTSPSPGQGSTTVAMNVAIAATKAGRRVMLVDGDTSPHGLSRYLSTGRTPGLTEVAAGEEPLSGAARLWNFSDGKRLPVLPSGAPALDAQTLSGTELADALDAVAARADIIIIDAPPVGWSDATPHLAVHADGSILVVSDTADAVVVAEAGIRLAQVGAPVLGYITNRAERVITPFAAIWKPFTARMAVSAFVLGAAFSIFTGAQLWSSWASIDREAFSLVEATDLLNDTTTSSTIGSQVIETTLTPTTTTTTEPPAVEPYRTFLLIGSDVDSGASDVILYLVLPSGDAGPFMVSFPRDLYVDNPCTGGQSRINALSHGCKAKGINGGTLLSVQVSAMTGIDVDHFAEFTFEGFKDIIDAAGGVEICLDYAVKDEEAELSLPAGCTNANGAQALGWVRTRKGLEYRDGIWKSMRGRSDLQRNVHQQDVIFELAKKLKDFDSPQQLTQMVASVADAFTLSDTLSITDAIGLAWSVRSIDLEDINRLVIPTELGRSPTNQSILRATKDVTDVIADTYGDSLPAEGRPG